MSDNLDIFKKVLIRPPGLRALRVLVVAAAVVFGTITSFALFSSYGMRTNLIGAVVAVVFFYLIPAVLSAETTSRIGGMTPNWTYAMSLCDQIAVFLFSVTIPFSDTSTEAWQIMWLGLATVYLINLIMVVFGRGRKRLAMSFVYPLIYPGWLLLVFHVFIGRLIGIQKVLYLRNGVFFLVSAFMLVLTLVFLEFLIRANVRGVSALDFLSTIILDEERALEEGVRTDVSHQALHIENGSRLTFNIPWLHPGPVQGFGGGRLTTELIDDDTFFLHVPSYHSLDLSDPEDIDRFKDTPEAELSERATRMHRIEAADFTLYGRRYGDRSIIYIDHRGIDDYDPSIIYEIKEQYPDICLIDLHNQPLGGEMDSLQRLDASVKHLKSGVDELTDRLEEAALHPYRAGHVGNREYRCLVEEVDDQRTCLLGINGNDAPPSLHMAEEILDFDETLVFTTDTHENLFDLARPIAPDAEELVDAARRAEEDLSDAVAGIGERVVENVKVLGRSYEGLITTLNLMARLVPVSLILYYIGIVFLIL